ncbi:MAG: hypothetical protein JWO36_3704 [Myxococcales bacterium]|nr:hypothetical protein [Myxococcales bacterium]
MSAGYATHVSKRLIAVSLASALSVALGCSANDDVPAPQISSVTPDHSPVGSVVTIVGNYFCQRPNTGNEDPTCAVSGTVNFETSPATPSQWSDTAIMVEVPALTAGSADVVVTAAGRTSNPVSFIVE